MVIRWIKRFLLQEPRWIMDMESEPGKVVFVNSRTGETRVIESDPKVAVILEDRK
jgi:hypothetical protein